MNTSDKREGPQKSTSYSCFGCLHEIAEKYTAQGDSGWDVYCTHPSFPEKKYIGNSRCTPKFCPYLKEI